MLVPKMYILVAFERVRPQQQFVENKYQIKKKKTIIIETIDILMIGAKFGSATLH